MNCGWCRPRGVGSKFWPIFFPDRVHQLGTAAVAAAPVMPLDTGQYLARHGWRGAGAPLDGENGRGLKRPLLIPQKRSLGGVGKDRDRAVEWWDDVFAVGVSAAQTGIDTAGWSQVAVYLDTRQDGAQGVGFDTPGWRTTATCVARHPQQARACAAAAHERVCARRGARADAQARRGARGRRQPTHDAGPEQGGAARGQGGAAAGQG